MNPHCLVASSACIVIGASFLAAQEPAKPTLQQVRKHMQLGEWRAAGSKLDELAGSASTRAERAVLMPLFAVVVRNLDRQDKDDLPVLIGAFSAVVTIARVDTRENDLPTFLQNLAVLLNHSGQPRAALPLFLESLELLRDAHSATAPVLLNATINLAACRLDLGHLAAAQELTALVDEVRRSRPENTALALQTLLAMGKIHEASGRSQAALAAAHEAVQLVSPTPSHPAFASAVAAEAESLLELGRAADALEVVQSGLGRVEALCQGDHVDVACLTFLRAKCLGKLARDSTALESAERSLAMYGRLFTSDHPEKSKAMGTVAAALMALGRFDQGVAMQEQTLAMDQRLYDADHPETARSLSSLGAVLQDAGREREATERHREALAMRRRMFGADHPEVADAMDALARSLQAQGRSPEALAMHEEAFAMQRRFCSGDHPDIARSLTSVGQCLLALGRPAEALVELQAGAAMYQRIYGADHPRVVDGLTNVARTLAAIDRTDDAQRTHADSLAICRRLYRGDHPLLVQTLNNVASGLLATDPARAHELAQEGVAMQRRLADREHPSLAALLYNEARSLELQQRTAEALPCYEQARAMWQRVRPGDHPDAVQIETGVARCMLSSGAATGEVEQHLAAAIAMAERLRTDAASLDPATRTDFYSSLKRHRTYELMRHVQHLLGRPGEVFHFAELSRGRQLLDLLQQGMFDPLAVARDRATADPAAARVIRRVIEDLAANLQEITTVQKQLLRMQSAAEVQESELVRLRERLAAGQVHRRRLLAEQSRLTADIVPAATPVTTAGIQTALGREELLLCYALGEESSQLILVPPGGSAPEVVPIGCGRRQLTELTDAWRRSLAPSPGKVDRGRDPATGTAASDSSARALAARLLPAGIWQRIRGQTRIWLMPDGPLHQLPFEALVVDGTEAEPVRWLDSGPPIAYVPSGTVLHWLRGRTAARAVAEVEVVAIADPDFSSHRGVQPLDAAAPRGHVARTWDLGNLPQLPGTRDEWNAMAKFIEPAYRIALIGTDATEAKLFAAAPQAGILHLATHGIAEELHGSSFSALALTMPPTSRPDDDGLLRLEDLLLRWSGRLRACNLVVLSACRTAVGAQVVDEAPTALPMGFLYAGASSVVATLWSVNDASTAHLMAEYYGRMVRDGTARGADRLRALRDAKRALRATWPSPYHWAPFLFYGSPD